VADDTSGAARDRQAQLFQAMTPEQRIAMAVDMSEAAFRMAEDGIRLRHPDYSDEEVGLTGIRLRIGDDLFRVAFPTARLLPA
jgi:hypothetical protein